MSVNKYKSEVMRLSDMLESTFQEVQYYKKRDIEGQAIREKLLIQIQKAKEENIKLTAERDYRQRKFAAEHDNGESHSNMKMEQDNSVLLNKSKIYMEKVNEIIKNLAD